MVGRHQALRLRLVQDGRRLVDEEQRRRWGRRLHFLHRDERRLVVVVVAHVRIVDSGLLAVGLGARRPAVRAVVGEGVAAGRRVGVAVVARGDVARRALLRLRLGVLCGAAARGGEAVAAAVALQPRLADFGAGGAAQDLAWGRDDDGCVGLVCVLVCDLCGWTGWVSERAGAQGQDAPGGAMLSERLRRRTLRSAAGSALSAASSTSSSSRRRSLMVSEGCVAG